MKHLIGSFLVLVILGLQGCSDGGDVSPDPVSIAIPETPVDTPTTPAPAPQVDPLPDTQPSAECEPDADDLLMLDLVNVARSQARQCGTDSFAATHALTWHCDLRIAARVHSQDMADNNFFSHTGSDGLNVGFRVTDTGYLWRTVGENIAAGYLTAEAVMQGWLESPGHCANIMSPAFVELGSALVLSQTADYPTYWTQVFAAPQ